MRGLLRLLLLLAVVLAVVWVVQNVDLEWEGDRAEAELRGAAEEVDEAVPDVDIDVDAIAEELKETGRVVRQRAEEAGEKVAEATDDARTTAAIKAKLALDPTLSALDVSVDTTDGRVTLAGSVDSHADIARAIQIAFEDDDVREVVSTLRVRPDRESSGPRKVTVVE